MKPSSFHFALRQRCVYLIGAQGLFQLSCSPWSLYS